MATLPIRSLGGVGIVTDTNPYDLPINAFSDGNNVIFDEGRISRAPVFKQLYDAIKSSKTWAAFGENTWDSAGVVTYESATGSSATLSKIWSEFGAQTWDTASSITFDETFGTTVQSSRFVGSFSDPAFGETVVIADNDGTVRAYPEGVLQDVTPATAGGLVSNEETWSACQAAGIACLSRKDMVPYARNLKTDASYKEMSVSNWPADTTCAVMRAYGDFLIALNVTKGVNSYPTMVKWSDIIPYSSPIANIDWNEASTTNSAGENVLAELKNPIKDGLSLGTQFIIYSTDQVWLMEYTGSSLVFNFRRLFPSGGIMNTNCVVEVEGKHFVFGTDDIYVHDGSTKKSIADNRVRRKIFKTLDLNKKHRTFVTHDSIANFIYFNYVSKADEVNFKGTDFCNKAAIYNYKEDTWSFMDLPNIVGGAEAQVVLNQSSYNAVNQDFQSYNTDYLSFEAASPKVPIMLGLTDTQNGLSESRIYATDLPTVGVVNLPAHPETFKPAYVTRAGLDMDEIQAGLRGYKTIRGIQPQAEFEISDGVFYWQLGATDLPGGPITYSTNFYFNPATDYQISSKVSGRYLAYTISTSNVENFRISGFDMDVMVYSRR